MCDQTFQSREKASFNDVFHHLLLSTSTRWAWPAAPSVKNRRRRGPISVEGWSLCPWILYTRYSHPNSSNINVWSPPTGISYSHTRCSQVSVWGALGHPFSPVVTHLWHYKTPWAIQPVLVLSHQFLTLLFHTPLCLILTHKVPFSGCMRRCLFNTRLTLRNGCSFRQQHSLGRFRTMLKVTICVLRTRRRLLPLYTILYTMSKVWDVSYSHGQVYTEATWNTCVSLLAAKGYCVCLCELQMGSDNTWWVGNEN